MKHFLTVTVSDQKAVKYALKGSVVTLGRSDGNAITLDVPEVSSCHLELRKTETGYQLNDLGSTNGTTVNGTRITDHALADGDEIVLGLVVRAHYAAVADEAAAQAAPAQPLQPTVVESPPKPASPTVVLKRAPLPAQPAQAAAQEPAQPAEPATDGVVVRKMTPPGAPPAEASSPVTPAQAAPEEPAEEENGAPKINVPKPGQSTGGGPKKLNFG